MGVLVLPKKLNYSLTGLFVLKLDHYLIVLKLLRALSPGPPLALRSIPFYRVIPLSKMYFFPENAQLSNPCTPSQLQCTVFYENKCHFSSFKFRNVALTQSTSPLKMVNVHFYHTVPQQLLPFHTFFFLF